MNMFSPSLLNIVFISVTVISIIVVTILLVFNAFFDPMRKKIKELGGKLSSRGVGVFSCDGRAVAIEYSPGSRGSSSCFTISINGTFGADLVIRAETSQDKFYKKIGLNKEIQISDKEIDEKLFFECDIPEFTKQLFFNPEVKPAVFEILSYFNSIEITRNKCAFIQSPCETLNKISNEAIMDSARKLLAFVPSIPRSVTNCHLEVTSFKTWKAISYFAGYGILAIGGICVPWASISFRVVDAARLWLLSIPVNLVLFTAAAYFVFQKIRGFSMSSKVFIHFLFSFGIGILLLGRFGVAVANGIFDKSPAQKFEQALVDMYTTTHKSSTTYHVVVSAWRLGGRGWEFTVGKGEYSRIRVGKTYYEITTKSGKFGFEWVLSERLIR